MSYTLCQTSFQSLCLCPMLNVQHLDSGLCDCVPCLICEVCSELLSPLAGFCVCSGERSSSRGYSQRSRNSVTGTFPPMSVWTCCGITATMAWSTGVRIPGGWKPRVASSWSGCPFSAGWGRKDFWLCWSMLHVCVCICMCV